MLGRYSPPHSQTSFGPGTGIIQADVTGGVGGSGVVIIGAGAGVEISGGAVIVGFGPGVIGVGAAASADSVFAGLAQLPRISSTHRNRMPTVRDILT